MFLESGREDRREGGSSETTEFPESGREEGKEGALRQHRN